MNIVLIGYRGSGKSALGRKLARRLGKVFVDTDAMVQERAGHSIRHIFETQGEPAFRRYEARAVQAACMNENAVISVGGGAVLDPANATLLRNAGRVIWLRSPPEVLCRRIRDDRDSHEQRPPLTELGGLDEVTSLLARRVPIYESLADHGIDTDVVTSDQAVEDVVRWLSAQAAN
jgi:shikimate kinase